MSILLGVKGLYTGGNESHQELSTRSPSSIKISARRGLLLRVDDVHDCNVCQHNQLLTRGHSKIVTHKQVSNWPPQPETHQYPPASPTPYNSSHSHYPHK